MSAIEKVLKIFEMRDNIVLTVSMGENRKIMQAIQEAV